MRLKHSKLSHFEANRLIEQFVAGTPARTAALLAGVNKVSATNFYHKLRLVIRERVGEDARSDTLIPIIACKVQPDSIVYTDSYRSYDVLDITDFHHMRINHSKLFVDKQNHINGIEKFATRPCGSGTRPSDTCENTMESQQKTSICFSRNANGDLTTGHRISS